MYYKISADIYYDYGISEEPPLPNGVSFLRGSTITEHITEPMLFSSFFTRDNPPKPFAEYTIPIWSLELVTLLEDLGVDNFQRFDAIIGAETRGLEWRDYYAVNIVGLVSAASISKSDYTKITSSPSSLPFSVFHNLVLKGSETNNLDLFRLAENPGILLAHERLIEAIKKRPRPGGWGITAIPVDQI